MADDATSPRRRIVLWPFFFCVLPILVGIGLVVFINRPGPATNESEAANSNGIPSLGSRGQSLPDSNDSPPEDSQADPPPAEVVEEDEEHPEETSRDNSEEQIKTWLSNLALATRSNNRSGIRIHHELLANARPHERVDALVEEALRNEDNAWVRIQFHRAFHADAAKREWSLRVYETRTAMFLGTDDQYGDGELAELRVHAKALLDWIIDSGAMDTRVMTMLRNVVDGGRPSWLLEIVLGPFLDRALREDRRDIAVDLRDDLEALATDEDRAWDERERAFLFWMLHFETRDDILVRIEQPGYTAFVPVLVGAFPPRAAPSSDDPSPLVEWLREHYEDIARIAAFQLKSSAPAAEKRRLIRRIAAHSLPGARKIITDGIDRRDENLADYLEALGRISATSRDLESLTSAADDAEAEIARGAIEGLRRSPLPGADDALRRILEQGKNAGVRSQALAALLDRTQDKEAMLDEYLRTNRPASLRAVAVAHVDGMERLMAIVREDPSANVRKAALDKLGAIEPEDDGTRSELYAFFGKVKTRDNSAVIRAEARKYAEAVKD